MKLTEELRASAPSLPFLNPTAAASTQECVALGKDMWRRNLTAAKFICKTSRGKNYLSKACEV